MNIRMHSATIKKKVQLLIFCTHSSNNEYITTSSNILNQPNFLTTVRC